LSPIALGGVVPAALLAGYAGASALVVGLVAGGGSLIAAMLTETWWRKHRDRPAGLPRS
jgi:hypothetical protein